MTIEKDDKKTPIGKIPLKTVSVAELNAQEESEQLRLLIRECFTGVHDRPIVQMACQHSVILRHAHEIAVRGTDAQRRKAIVALSGIVLDGGK